MKSQGFTLVELLAVIVILAVLALIATPVVLSIIDDTKESAMLRSAEMYLSGVENAVMRENMNTGGNFRPTECTISSEGNLDCEGKDGIIEVEVNGEKPKNGKIKFENGKIKEVNLVYQSGTIVKDFNGSLVYEGSEITYISRGNYVHELSNGIVESHDTGSGICSKCGENVLDPGLYKEDGTFISWDDLILNEYLFVDNGKLIPGYDEDYYYTNSYMNTLIDVLKGKLVIPISISSIDGASFSDGAGTSARYMTEILLPNTITEIYAFTFSDCKKLNNVKIPSSVTSIGNDAFDNCTGLTNITIPKEVKSIESCAFEYCINLTAINFLGTKEEWNNIKFANDWNSGCPEITVHCTDGDIIIPASNA